MLLILFPILDGSFPCTWAPVRSPISSLPTLFDQTVSTSSGQMDSVPQATPNIEQLLEKQGNGEAGVNSESCTNVEGGHLLRCSQDNEEQQASAT